MRARLALLSVVWVVALSALPATAVAEPVWAPVETATIHPGVQTFTDGAQCTANFVFFDANDDIYIGQAAHCAGLGAATETDGCIAETHPEGTPVEVDGASAMGTLAYSSWVTMQDNREDDANICAYNDFALIKLDPVDYGKVNPSVPFFGGPNALGSTSALGDRVYSYGNSGLRFGASPLSPKEGYSLGAHSDGWSHDVYTVTPGIPGDSGSAFLDPSGAALGTLSTVALLPFPASNGVSDLSRELAYAVANSGIPGLQLALGTEDFVGGLLP